MGLNILNSTEDKLKKYSIKDIIRNFNFIEDCLEKGIYKFSIDSSFL